MIKNKLIKGLVLFSLALCVVFGIGHFGRNQAVAQSQVVNVYSSRHYNTDRVLYDDFRRQTGIRVNVVEAANAGQLIARIKSEGAQSPADILITVDAGNLWIAQQEGLLAPVRSAVLERRIPANLRDPDGHWFGFSRRVRVIFFNRDRVNFNELTGHRDLADPRFRGRVVMRSSSNIYNKSFAAAMIAREGRERTEQWVRGMVANFARPPAGNDTSNIRDVAAGVGDLTMGNTYYYARLAASDRPEDQEVVRRVGVFFPDQRGDGAHVNISGGGLIRTAPNRANAIRFMEYLVSNRAQEYFAGGNFEYPVVAGVPLHERVRAFGVFRESRVSSIDFGRNQAEAVRIFDRAGWR